MDQIKIGNLYKLKGNKKFGIYDCYKKYEQKEGEIIQFTTGLIVTLVSTKKLFENETETKYTVYGFLVEGRYLFTALLIE
jgi:hypothetical protein